MMVTVNGEKKEFTESALTVGGLITALKVQDPEMVSVQHNGEFAERTTYNTQTVRDGDEIDFLYFMGGGAL